MSETSQIDWFTFCVGIILGFLAFEIIERTTIVPEKVIAFILLFLSFTSFGMLVSVFFIRKSTYLIFSFVMGNFLSLFLHIAFISRFIEQKRISLNVVVFKKQIKMPLR